MFSHGIGGMSGPNMYQLFAMLLEVILREIRPIFNQTYLFFRFLEEKRIIYQLIAYDPKIAENV